MATQDPTVNYNWNLPAVGGDTGAWGGMLNTIIGDDATGIDAVLKAVSDVANAALPKAGGTLTGLVKHKVSTNTVSNKGTMTGAVTLDLSANDFFYGTKSGAITFTWSNPPTTGTLIFFMLEITNGGSAGAITWPSGLEWVGGVEPTLQSTGVDLLLFYTYDAGATWRGGLAMENLS